MSRCASGQVIVVYVDHLDDAFVVDFLTQLLWLRLDGYLGTIININTIIN